MLSESLRGVVAQTLFTRADKQGRVAAFEILKGTLEVGKGKNIHQLKQGDTATIRPNEKHYFPIAASASSFFATHTRMSKGKDISSACKT